MVGGEQSNPGPDRRSGRVFLLVGRLALLAAIVMATNTGVPERISILVEEGKWVGLVAFAGLWAISLAALAAAALQPNILIRSFWALVISLSGAVGFGFYLASQTEMSIYDVVSLWSARHETARAVSFYASSATWAAVIFVATVVLFMLPSPLADMKRRGLRLGFAVAPLVPIVAFMVILSMRHGDGTRALPAQFAPVSIGLVAGMKVATNSMPERSQVQWSPGSAKIKRVVMVVDESVRADYIDWTPGNPYTPSIAALKSRVIDFGPASSGGNCSAYSNAILRFGAARHDLMQTLLRNATIWQYAKKAGFRTVFIDAQAGFIKKYSGKLQNYMTPAEANDIDNFHALDGDITPPELDDRLLDIILADLKTSDPVFIYAVKNGAHFPYDMDYPYQTAEFHPTMGETSREDDNGRVNSYRNAIKWSTDRFLKRLFEQGNLKDTVVIYTSDHGQNLSYKHLTHCTIDDPDPREGLVPLVAMTGDEAMRARLTSAAAESRGHASHFQIVPTILQLFGFHRYDVASVYGPSMFEKSSEPAQFTSGDIFGLFSSHVRWHPIDLNRSYLEAQPRRAGHAAAATDGRARPQ
jgi:glucan phosphoethanolaminetransferase (alkaline phosphatase superfamily)